MRISLITATFNSSNVLDEMISSLNSQTNKNYEHIIVDAVSYDDTILKLKNLLIRPPSIVSEPDSGIYNALNKGIQRASGEYIGFLHSDDYFADDNVIFDIQAFIEREEPDILDHQK